MLEEHTVALHEFCKVERDLLRCVPEALILSFNYDTAATTMRIVLYTYRDELHLEITHMTTLPEPETGKGYGSHSLQRLLQWKHENDVQSVRAVQVSPLAERFWSKNGFVKMNNETNDFMLNES